MINTNKEGNMAGWYVIRKKEEKRWTVYKLSEKPSLKRGYEMRGPFKSLVHAIMSVNTEAANV
jgi:hypothetical protein